ncbi:hypothetical protein BX616_001211 [Lobosporangium transversale]|uniref:Uncharacterized protein n=1 Tax=Lobosporangium transversale TaxID=64571 RepID=A0A1Y2GKW3_9FUNG|nr:hypothetical protein BCR41DRAFT_398471 [Lobosporangium transversale]KAF9904750.1 hypothetical protein BX616_001211 [Lobosporangium transversale]ORZ10375.1 hypothetical protein BCR41DRAFT_398471 [Lobosporangium transversale]|eukprot:XP_021879282.1 hypothetical protein BCR41DRAFT_398471 [Lobosporangium transversale]
MLQRRNAIHPFPKPLETTNPFISHEPALNLTKNPFLSSSCEDIKSHHAQIRLTATNPVYDTDTIKHAQYEYHRHRRQHQQYQQQHIQASSNAATASASAVTDITNADNPSNTNPFLYQPATTSATHYSTTNDGCGAPIDLWDECIEASGEGVLQEYESSTSQRKHRLRKRHQSVGSSEEGGRGGSALVATAARRLSLNLFKVPLEWHRRRHATCASSGLERVLKERQSSLFNSSQKEELLSSLTYLDIQGQDQHPTHQHQQQPSFLQVEAPYQGNKGGNKDDKNVILKSSRYESHEEVEVNIMDRPMSGISNRQPLQGQGQESQEQGQKRPLSPLNPFLASSTNPDFAGVANTHSIKPICQGKGEGQQQQQEEGGEENDKDLDEKQTRDADLNVKVQLGGHEDAHQTTYPVRQRHSIFSDWSIEDCSHHLTSQKNQGKQGYSSSPSSKASLARSTTDTALSHHFNQDNASNRNSHQLHRRMSATIAYHRRQHRNSAPVPPLPSSALANRSHRNSAIVGRDIVQRLSRQPSKGSKKSDNRLSHDDYHQSIVQDKGGQETERDIGTQDDDRVGNANDDNVGCGDEGTSDGPQDNRTYRPTHKNHESWNAVPNPRPARLSDRSSWQPRSSAARRESQSYAQDFMKDSERWVPPTRPWTLISTTAGLNITSPLYKRAFPHEREGRQESIETEIGYHDMKRVQTQPYGQEEKEEVEEEIKEQEDYIGSKGMNLGDQAATTASFKAGGFKYEYDGSGDEDYIQKTTECAEERGSVYDFGAHLDHQDHCISDDIDVRYYYNSVDWQRRDTMDEMIHDYTLQDQQHTPLSKAEEAWRRGISTDSSSTASCTLGAGPDYSRSRELFARKALLAKAKFYRLLKQPRSLSSYDKYTHHQNMCLEQDIEEDEIEDGGADVEEVVLQGYQEEGEGEEGRVDIKAVLQEYQEEEEEEEGGAIDGKYHDPPWSATPASSTTTSLRSKMRLDKTKATLHQVKHRIGAAARKIISDANKAANTVTPTLWNKHMKRKGTARTGLRTEEPEMEIVMEEKVQRSLSSPDHRSVFVKQALGNKHDDGYGQPNLELNDYVDHQQQYFHYNSGFNSDGMTKGRFHRMKPGAKR